MDLVVNDLSLHGQFADLESFRSAIARVMKMRQIARRFSRALHCHRNMANAQVTRELSMLQAVQSLRMDEKRSLMQWLTQQGPFWEDTRLHDPDHYLTCRSDIVTDTAVGEAAFCCLQQIERRVVSLSPSAWEFSPIPVSLIPTSADEVKVDVHNHWQPEELEIALQAAPTPLGSWEELANTVGTRCPGLTFWPGSFDPLRGRPFSEGAAQRLLVLLNTLHRLSTCFGADGKRTPEGQQLYQDHFVSDKAWFSDSSDTEKREFEGELTFRHPTRRGEVLFCTWHGKVKTPQLRIHFSWPVRANEPIHVVYVGPKITKR